MKVQKSTNNYSVSPWEVVDANGVALETGPLPTREAAREWVRSAKLAASVVDEIIAEEKPNHEAAPVEAPAAETLADCGTPLATLVQAVCDVAEVAVSTQEQTIAPLFKAPTATEFRNAPTRTPRLTPSPLVGYASFVETGTRPAPSPRPLRRHTSLGFVLRVSGLDSLLPGALQGPPERRVVVAPYACLTTGRLAV